MDEVREAVLAAGLRIEEALAEERVARAPSAAGLLRALRRQGLTGGAISRAERPLDRGEVERLARAYDARHGGPGGVNATCRVGYVVGRRPR